jgi:hypothetical protein
VWTLKRERGDGTRDLPEYVARWHNCA